MRLFLSSFFLLLPFFTLFLQLHKKSRFLFDTLEMSIKCQCCQRYSLLTSRFCCCAGFFQCCQTASCAQPFKTNANGIEEIGWCKYLWLKLFSLLEIGRMYMKIIFEHSYYSLKNWFSRDFLMKIVRSILNLKQSKNRSKCVIFSVQQSTYWEIFMEQNVLCLMQRFISTAVIMPTTNPFRKLQCQHLAWYFELFYGGTYIRTIVNH